MFLSIAWEPLDQAVVDCVFPSRAWEPLDQAVRGSCVSRQVVANSCLEVAILKDFLDIEAEEEGGGINTPSQKSSRWRKLGPDYPAPEGRIIRSPRLSGPPGQIIRAKVRLDQGRLHSSP